MAKNIKKHIKPLRLDGLPDDMRRKLKEARRARGWSQQELGQRIGLPQMHVSGIESGKIVPRFDTLLDLVRALDQDLLLVPRALVPAVQALVRDHRSHDEGSAEGERALYADDGDGEEPRTHERGHDEV
jgi:transcriptional regulator with XRE-family HTH domain